jgi:tRNA uridine 5-carboxymethylaminomethyl modification enzyme
MAGASGDIPIDALTSAELEIKYAGYFERERVQAERLKRLGHVALAPDLEYSRMRSLTFEARQKLAQLRPHSLAQAASIPGVSPNDIQNLLIEIERQRRVVANSQSPS